MHIFVAVNIRDHYEDGTASLSDGSLYSSLFTLAIILGEHRRPIFEHVEGLVTGLPASKIFSQSKLNFPWVDCLDDRC